MADTEPGTVLPDNTAEPPGMPEQVTGIALVAEEPRLLVPLQLSGMPLALLQVRRGNLISVTAQYTADGEADLAGTAESSVDVTLTRFDEPEPRVAGEGERAVSVAGRGAVRSLGLPMGGSAGLRRSVGLEWTTGVWAFSVGVWHRPPRLGEAERLLTQAAAQLALRSDRYLGDGPVPTREEGAEHVERVSAKERW
ncbi:MAG: hypothetical protein HYY06_32910 [Deltaproteobacteria bacterium]|nr:hypothetical protein [Deltaproteobacteria bacterium]